MLCFLCCSVASLALCGPAVPGSAADPCIPPYSTCAAFLNGACSNHAACKAATHGAGGDGAMHLLHLPHSRCSTNRMACHFARCGMGCSYGSTLQLLYCATMWLVLAAGLSCARTVARHQEQRRTAPGLLSLWWLLLAGLELLWP